MRHLMHEQSGEWTIEGLFQGRPNAFNLFQIVRTYIESLGPVKVEAMKTQVSFGAKRKFAWVWLPQMWIRKRPNQSITLTFDLHYRLKHPLIEKAVEPRPGLWTHHVIMEKPSDLNNEVRSWLLEAYKTRGT